MKLTTYPAASGGSVFTAGAVALVTAPPCAAILVGIWGMAKIALSQGKCVGVRGAKAPILTGMHGVYIPCYA